MRSSVPNFSSVGPTVWPSIDNTHTQSPLFYILMIWQLSQKLFHFVLVSDRRIHIQADTSTDCPQTDNLIPPALLRGICFPLYFLHGGLGKIRLFEKENVLEDFSRNISLLYIYTCFTHRLSYFQLSFLVDLQDGTIFFFCYHTSHLYHVRLIDGAASIIINYMETLDHAIFSCLAPFL